MSNYIVSLISVLYFNTCYSQKVEKVKISDVSNQISFAADRNSVLTSISNTVVVVPNKLSSVVGVSDKVELNFADSNSLTLPAIFEGKFKSTSVVNAGGKIDPADGDRGIVSKAKETTNIEPTPVVTMLPLPKQIKIELPTDERSIISEVSKELGADFKFKLPSYYALIIGISSYKFSGAGLPSLENPAKDAEKLYQTLTSGYQFPIANVKLLKDATRQQIIDQLEILSNSLTEKDNLLIFYAGHGFYDKVKEFGYWLPSDARITSRSEWIPNSTIKDYISAIKSKHTLLISDACFGGSIFKTRNVDEYMIMKISNLYRDPSRRAITSGNLNLVPDKSIFIDYLIKRLSDNEDLFLPALNLFTRIYEPVSNNSPTTPQFGVVQRAGDEGGDFIFIKRK